MSVRQLLNYVYSWAVRRVDEERFDQWRLDLYAPYWEGQRGSASPSSAEAEKDAFRAAMAAG